MFGRATESGETGKLDDVADAGLACLCSEGEADFLAFDAGTQIRVDAE